MVKATRALVLGGVMAALFIAVERVNATEGQQPADSATSAVPSIAGVRTGDPVLGVVIQAATDRSPTFRRLVEAIQAANAIAYVERGRCGTYVRSCLAYWMGMAGPHRLLLVIVDDRKSGVEVAASLGHELQHAVEVLEHPGVRTGVEMHGLFERIGVPRFYGFETYAAVDAGRAVRAEMRKRKPSPARPPG